MSTRDILIVGNSSDDPFTIDVAHAMRQAVDIADIISLKNFANSEFCPRFISDESDFDNVGNKLDGKTVIIVSTSNRVNSRQSLAMRNLMIARSAKENGAAEVILVEPDLFYSAQDRGPRMDYGETDFDRNEKDLKKFDGQPFTSRLYAQLLKVSGVDKVVTVHNHSHSVSIEFNRIFENEYYNLIPYELYVDYVLRSDIVKFGRDGDGLALCAPDKGAREFVQEIYNRFGLQKAKFILLDKERTGERQVDITLHPESVSGFEEIKGHDIVLFDDMVRTGSTVVKSCELLKAVNPGKTVFALTHFHASDEGRASMASTAIDEILTLNTIPTILNRDVQGRLRKKMVVLKIEKWIAKALCNILELEYLNYGDSPYAVDMSSKNQRWVPNVSMYN